MSKKVEKIKYKFFHPFGPSIMYGTMPPGIFKEFKDIVTNVLEKKEDGLNPYYFSVTIENAIVKGYWTEKLLDAFATKTIPIYYGDKFSVNKFFNEDGILYFNTIEELDDIMEKIQGDDNGAYFYNERLSAIEENFNKVEEFRVPEDWIYKEYPFLFE